MTDSLSSLLLPPGGQRVLLIMAYPDDANFPVSQVVPDFGKSGISHPKRCERLAKRPPLFF